MRERMLLFTNIALFTLGDINTRFTPNITLVSDFRLLSGTRFVDSVPDLHRTLSLNSRNCVILLPHRIYSLDHDDNAGRFTHGGLFSSRTHRASV